MGGQHEYDKGDGLQPTTRACRPLPDWRAASRPVPAGGLAELHGLIGNAAVAGLLASSSRAVSQPAVQRMFVNGLKRLPDLEAAVAALFEGTDGADATMKEFRRLRDDARRHDFGLWLEAKLREHNREKHPKAAELLRSLGDPPAAAGPAAPTAPVGGRKRKRGETEKGKEREKDASSGAASSSSDSEPRAKRRRGASFAASTAASSSSSSSGSGRVRPRHEASPAAKPPPDIEQKWQDLSEGLGYLLPKGVKNDLACWNWALTGLTSEGLSPEIVFSYLNGLATKEELDEHAALVRADICARIHAAAKEMRDKRLALSQRLKSDTPLSKEQQEEARPILESVVEAMVAAHGFEIVARREARLFVEVQFKLTSGVSWQHWWIKYDDVFIETVPDADLNIYKEDPLEREEHRGEYGVISVPVRNLKQAHVDFIVEGMNDASPCERG